MDHINRTDKAYLSDSHRRVSYGVVIRDREGFIGVEMTVSIGMRNAMRAIRVGKSVEKCSEEERRILQTPSEFIPLVSVAYYDRKRLIGPTIKGYRKMRDLPDGWGLEYRWTPPKGAAMIGESHLGAAMRETYEETGMIADRDYVVSDAPPIIIKHQVTGYAFITILFIADARGSDVRMKPLHAEEIASIAVLPTETIERLVHPSIGDRLRMVLPWSEGEVRYLYR